MKAAPAFASVALLASAAALGAQGYRADVSVHGALLELRPMLRDSLPEADVAGEGRRRRLPDGTVVTCVPDEFCRWYASSAPTSVTVTTQDVRVAAWGGIPGLSAHAHVRGRYGTDDVWPLASQEVEAVDAYLNYDPGEYRLRAGRQHRTDGLGYYNFDGIAALWRGFEPVRVEAFGGWSLGRGLNAPRTGDLLRETDEFAPDRRALTLGAEVGARWGRRLAGALTYRREVTTDLEALIGERLALDVRGSAGRLTADLSAEYDVAFEEVNEARLRLSAPVGRGVRVSVEGRHYTPFFELWTIWGAFSPVGFNEASGSASWRDPAAGLLLELGGAYRAYGETDAGADFAPVEEDGWRAFGNAEWRRGTWSAAAGYRAEIGFGAARMGGDVRVGRRLTDGASLALRGTSTLTVDELRLGGHRLDGGGLDGVLRLGEVDLTGSVGLYRISFVDRPTMSDWTQARGHIGIRYRFGTDLGTTGGGP